MAVRALGWRRQKLPPEAGARVTIASRSRERLDNAAATIGHGTAARTIDTSSDASVAAFFADDKAWDHVVASAGAGGRGQIATMPMADAQAVMNTKFWGYFRIARAVKIVPSGSLTFISGRLSQKPSPAASLISAVNSAIEGLARGLAVDFAPTRVNTISPGVIETALWDQLPAAARQQMYEHTAATLPVRRVGQPEDVGHATLFLMTNPFITGAIIQLDGGSLLV